MKVPLIKEIVLENQSIDPIKSHVQIEVQTFESEKNQVQSDIENESQSQDPTLAG